MMIERLDNVTARRANLPLRLDELLEPDGQTLFTGPSGCGKTRLLELKILRLLDRGVPAESVLLLCGTQRSGTDLTDRLGAGDARARGVVVRNRFEFLVATLREHHGPAKLPPRFSVLDAEERSALIARCAEQTRSVPRGQGAALAADLFGLLARMTLRPLLPFAHHAREGYERYAGSEQAVRQIRHAYEQAKSRGRCLDAADVIARATALLATAYVQGKIGRFRHVLVDDLQAVSPPMFDALELVVRPHGNLTAAADPQQAIDRFAVPDEGVVKEFLRRFPAGWHAGCATAGAKRTFAAFVDPLRPAEELPPGAAPVAAAAGPPRTPTGAAAAPPKPVLRLWTDEPARAAGVAEEVVRAAGDAAAAAAASGQVVLYTDSAQTHALRAALSRHGIGVHMVGHPGPDAYAHVGYALAHLRVLDNFMHRPAWLRVLEFHGLGVRASARLADLATSAENLEAAIAAVADAAACELPQSHRRVSKLAAALRRAARMARPAEQYDAVLALVEPVVERRFRDGAAERLRELDALRADVARHADVGGFLDAFVNREPELRCPAAPRGGRCAGDEDRDRLLTVSPVSWAVGQQWECVHLLCSDLDALGAARPGERFVRQRRLLYTAGTRATRRLVLHYCPPAGEQVAVQRLSELLEVEGCAVGKAAG